MNSTTKSLIKIMLVLLLSGCTFFLPYASWGVELNMVQQGVVALFVMAALMWILEPIPIWTTSTLVITICLLCMSSSAFTFLRPAVYDAAVVEATVDSATLGKLTPTTKENMMAAIKKTLKGKSNLDATGIITTIDGELMKNAAKAAKKTPAEPDKAAEAEALQGAVLRMHDGTVDLAPLKNMTITNVMQQKAVMATFADPIIILFLGGFFLAAAATKYRLDISLAKALLKPFGTNPKFVLLGLMCVTALFSMFMSNTATAAMMLAILGPVLALFAPEDRGRAAFALCIPVAANIGGIGTPIGTPPNAIALKAMQDMGLTISFGKWMLFGVPFVAVMLLIGWLLLIKMFPIKAKSIELKMEGEFLKTPKAIIVYVTFAVSILLWVFSDLVGVDANTVAIVPIGVFAVTGVITAKDLKSMSWDVLWLVAGGFALGVALQQTNLAKDLINAIPFASWNATMLMVGAGSICLFMATFMSHTATASLLMPILAAVAGTMVGAGVMDNAGAIGLLCAIAFSSSLGMALPISTPPNALAYATGLVEQKGMAVSGTILCLTGLVLTFVLMYVLNNCGFFA
ncbi:MAG: SLC13 family permease [Akkermansia sp.]